MPKYYNTWEKHLPKIYLAVDKSIFFENEVLLELDYSEFESIGERYVSGYGFRLEIQNGQIINDVTGSIVARDLFDILSRDEQQQSWLKNKYILIRMDKSFLLAIKSIKI